MGAIKLMHNQSLANSALYCYLITFNQLVPFYDKWGITQYQHIVLMYGLDGCFRSWGAWGLGLFAREALGALGTWQLGNYDII